MQLSLVKDAMYDLATKQQKYVEDTYAPKSIRQHVIADVGKDTLVFKACIAAVEKYMSQGYYDSKNKRIKILRNNELSIDAIVMELFVAVLPSREMSPIQSIATQLGNRLGFFHLLDGVKTASELIAVCESTGLYTIYCAAEEDNETGTLALISNYKLSDEVQDFINKTMYLPPMLCTPNSWTNNVNGGHLNGSSSVILGAINHHNEKQALDAINTLQLIPWELNEDLLEIEEQPNKPLDTEKKRQQFHIMANLSKQVYRELLKTGNKFYFVWKYDKRGRSYSQGYHTNLQSTQYKKAILQFKNKEILS